MSQEHRKDTMGQCHPKEVKHANAKGLARQKRKIKARELRKNVKSLRNSIKKGEMKNIRSDISKLFFS